MGVHGWNGRDGGRVILLHAAHAPDAAHLKLLLIVEFVSLLHLLPLLRPTILKPDFDLSGRGDPDSFDRFGNQRQFPLQPVTS
ncbi:hypothetical protein E2C01_027853 [Portunus trituberculatus]|uniref:Uncharacterized protein n=1 Tax=Portunus trituberculatus TaxID=210409 RepID=A0A5B7EJR6_PORTR|nr:hypothetical protein [Portunus trituberculatus]